MKQVGLLVKVLAVVLAGYWLVRSDAGVLALMGMIFGGTATLVGGWRIGLAVSLADVVTVGVGGSLHAYPVAIVAFAGALAFAIGYAARWGLYAAWLSPFIFGVIAATAPHADVFGRRSVWPEAVLVGLGSLIAVGILQIPPTFPMLPRLPALTNDGALIFAAIAALGVVLLTAVVLASSSPHGYWVVSAFMACLQPAIGRSRSRAIRRQVGTVAGVAAGLAIDHFVSGREVLWTLASVSLVLCVVFMSRYDWSVGFVSLAIVLVAATSGSAAATAADRLLLNIAGAALVLVLSITLGPVLVQIDKRVPLVDRSARAVA